MMEEMLNGIFGKVAPGIPEMLKPYTRYYSDGQNRVNVKEF